MLVTRIPSGRAQFAVTTVSPTRTFRAVVALASVTVLAFIAMLALLEVIAPTPTLKDPGATGAAAPVAVPATMDFIFQPGAVLPWTLDLHHPESQASLEVRPDSPTRVRVAITAAAVPTLYNIQLNLPGIPVTTSDTYELRFRIRSDAPRVAFYGVSMAHEPWHGLGFYRRIELGPDWQPVTDRVVVASSDANARLHFDLGASAVPVEIEAVSMRPVGR